MALYDKPVRLLFRDMVTDLGLQPGDTFSRQDSISWFKENYPLVKTGTITAHLIRLSTNAPSRHHYGAKPVEDDLFYQIDGNKFRLFEPQSDPAPIYVSDNAASDVEDIEDVESNAAERAEFAYERDLQNFLVRNLHLLESSLRLFEDEGINGIEFPVGGRFIDILAVDGQGNYVIIELKVSKGYDRVLGQILRYMAWVKENLAEGSQQVRGIIIARNISDDLRLACSLVDGIRLYEYELSVALREV